MSFRNVVSTAYNYFPNLQIKYKNNSKLMKFFGKILFFNSKFISCYTTTINYKVYYPNPTFVKTRPISASIILLHEIVHMYDYKRLGKWWFIFSYLFPQILSFLLIPLLVIGWKIALCSLIFLLPLPAVFRMYYEKRAYLASLYIMNILGKRLNFDPMLQKQKEYFISQFSSSYYYFMWVLPGLKKDFDLALDRIMVGHRPYEDPVFDILDELSAQV